MAKRNKQETTSREKYSEDVINELLGEIEDEPDIEIEEDVLSMGNSSEDDAKTAEPDEEKSAKTRRWYFAAAVFIIIMAVIGLVSSVRFVVKGISNMADNTALKTEFARFLLPVVANDIAPFEDESEITNSSKVSCSIWNILINKDTSEYKPSSDGGILVPEYDVSVSCKELFGAKSTLSHQTVGVGDSRFVYDEKNHVYTCSKNMRYLNYAPKITEMTGRNGTYVLTVDYIPPSITMAVEGLGITSESVKTLEYTISRVDKKNTLVSVRFISGTQDVG